MSDFTSTLLANYHLGTHTSHNECYNNVTHAHLDTLHENVRRTGLGFSLGLSAVCSAARDGGLISHNGVELPCSVTTLKS